MKNKTIIKWGAFAVAVVLAAMGCWFCWNCPMDCLALAWRMTNDRCVDAHPPTAGQIEKVKE